MTNDNTPRFSGSAEPNALVTLTSSIQGTVGVVEAVGGLWSLDLSALNDGTHNISAVATDVSGNTGASSLTTTIVVGEFHHCGSVCRDSRCAHVHRS